MMLSDRAHLLARSTSRRQIGKLIGDIGDARFGAIAEIGEGRAVIGMLLLASRAASSAFP
jgi:hypothetical protein